MCLKHAVVLSVVLGVCWCGQLDFPPGFRFGAATAAYQVEGAWNVSDKAPSVWDHYTHAFPELIGDRSNGDVACDSYHQYKRDVEIAKELGLHFYRFSISWPRLLPNGFANHISEDGKRYYNDLIDELLKNNIEPVVTLYHWDLPKNLQDLGGFANPYIVEWFGDYSRVVYTLFADRVKTWITFNEPIIICDLNYDMEKIVPPFVNHNGVFLCNKNLLLAHAKSYRIYDQEFRPKYQGKISFANQMIWMDPASKEDEEVTIMARDYYYGRYTHPVYSKEGGWPKELEKAMADVSREQGYPRSKLPPLSQEEIEFIRGTYDFFALNHYTSRMVRRAKPVEPVVSTLFSGVPDLNIRFEADPAWKKGAAFWFWVYPEGLRKQLVWLKDQYGDLEILITENGYCETEDRRDDDDRIDYYRRYLEQVLLAIKEDKVNVVGYTAWTLIDNFEWIEGYKTKFGLYEVDFNDPQRTRTARKSAKFYSEVIKHHSLDISTKKAEL